MILIGGFPSGTGLVFGQVGITPDQIAASGNASSPLLNDVDPGDTLTQFLWRLQAPYVAVGTTQANDLGAYQLSGAPDGTHVQPYGLWGVPATGPTTYGATSITTVVGVAATAPTISSQPQSLAVIQGDAAAFAVTAVGTAPLAYQWRRNGVALAGQTSASYVLPSAQATDDGAAYSVVVSNAAGSITSANAVLTVQALAGQAPQISVHPASQVVAEGQAVTFAVVATGTAPITYGWRRNGTPIAGAVASTLSITAAGADNGAAYTVVVSNAFGSLQSQAALLSVTVSTTSPVITTNIANLVADVGATVAFGLAVTGAQPITYEWLRDGQVVAGVNAPNLSVQNCDLADHRATFQVRVTNAYGAVTSRRATLFVPVIGIAEARDNARVDDDRFDQQIPGWIDTALSMAEQFCNRDFSPKSPRFDLSYWPTDGDTFPVYQAKSVNVTFWDGAAWQALGDGLAKVFDVGTRSGVAPAISTTWPVLGEVAGGPRVRLQFTAGPTSADELPHEVRTFILAHVALWADENRAATAQANHEAPHLYHGLNALKIY